jgi:pimeloyl-ACP methyl ester carboxylesterase
MRAQQIFARTILSSRVYSTALVSLGFIALASAVSAKAPAEQSALLNYVRATTPAAAGGTLTKSKCCNVTEWKLTTPEGEAVEVTVVDPLAKGKRPMVLWLHREGQEVKRAGFMQEAEALAAAGVASLLVELPFKQPYQHRGNNNVGDADAIRLAVINARRALDWAATRPEFDIKKVAVVGHRFGAWAATLLTGVDERVDAVLLMSPPGKPSGWLQVTEQPKAKAFRESFDKAQWGAYLNSIEPLDPERWIQFVAPAKVHFQFGSGDAWVQTLEQVDLFRAASQPKSRLMFDADELLNDEAKKDRFNWLKRVLTGK